MIPGDTALLAHRGYSKKYPENTLLALRAALELGAPSVEIDVHLSKDHVPVVVHDRTLQRTCGVRAEVHTQNYTQLAAISAHYPEKFQSRYLPEPIPSLTQVVELMQQWPQRRLFVEIKRGGLEYFGIDLVLGQVMQQLHPIADRCILISFDDRVPELAKRFGAGSVGWVFEDWSDSARQTAVRLQPEYLLTDYTTIPEDEPLWSGPWQWVLYAVDEPSTARWWLSHGAHIIETNDIELLLQQLTNTTAGNE